MTEQQSEKAGPVPDTLENDGPGDIDFTLIELLFFAYRDFISDPDAILGPIGFGRAHHRVVHFVNRRPGLTVAERAPAGAVQGACSGPAAGRWRSPWVRQESLFAATGLPSAASSTATRPSPSPSTGGR